MTIRLATGVEAPVPLVVLVCGELKLFFNSKEVPHWVHTAFADICRFSWYPQHGLYLFRGIKALLMARPHLVDCWFEDNGMLKQAIADILKACLAFHGSPVSPHMRFLDPFAPLSLMERQLGRIASKPLDEYIPSSTWQYLGRCEYLNTVIAAYPDLSHAITEYRSKQYTPPDLLDA